MKAVVIGATGATGKELVKLLCQEDKISEVIALVVREKLEEHPKLTQRVVDFLDPESYRGYLKGTDVAFSCMGTTLKAAGSKEAQWIVDYDYQLDFAKMAKESNTPQFVLLSAMNANAQAKGFYSRMKGKLEQSVKLIGFEKLVILKPSLLIRPNSDRSLENTGVAIFKGLNKLGFMLKYRPIHVEVVAKAMLLCALNSTKPVTQLNVENILKITS